MIHRIALLVVLLLVGGLSAGAQAPTLPRYEELPAGELVTLSPGGETSCALGEDYQFYFRRSATPANGLLIFFQGGGGCWGDLDCGLGQNISYRATIDRRNATTLQGMSDFQNEANPFAGYDYLLVSYCTGDMHMGVRDRDYEANNIAFTVRHRGYINASAALNWVYENVPDPDRVFVTGSSAGALATPFYVPLIADAYPDARIGHLGDAGGGYYRLDFTPAYASWGTCDILPGALQGIGCDDLSQEAMYIAAAQAYPEVTFAQFNYAEDSVQRTFLSIYGERDLSLKDSLDVSFAEISAAVPNFRYYTAPGERHTLLRSPLFYTLTVDEVRFVDWLTALVNGEDVPNVDCGAAC